MDNDISCVFEGLGSIGTIYISNSKTASNVSILQRLNIKTVITAAKGRKIEYPINTISDYIYLQIDDYSQFRIQKYFDETFKLIEQSRKKTHVLIHCHVGASRSATIVIAYLIRKYHYSLSQIYAIIKRKRSIIKPNPGFIEQLQKYSQQHSVNHQQLQVNKKTSKLKSKRSTSLIQAFPSLTISQFTQIDHQIIKSRQILKSKQNKNQKLKFTQHKNKQQTQRKRSNDSVQVEIPKIQKLHNQRKEIQHKLRNLRHSLIKGGQRMRKGGLQKWKSKDMGIAENSISIIRHQNSQNKCPNVEMIAWTYCEESMDKSTASTFVSNHSQILQKGFSKTLPPNIQPSKYRTNSDLS